MSRPQYITRVSTRHVCSFQTLSCALPGQQTKSSYALAVTWSMLIVGGVYNHLLLVFVRFYFFIFFSNSERYELILLIYEFLRSQRSNSFEINLSCIEQSISLLNSVSTKRKGRHANCSVNSLRPSDAIYRHRYGSPLAQVLVVAWQDQFITWTMLT